MFNFDEPIDRHNTNSFKWDKYSDKSVIPVWVADMDFKAAPPIIEALNKVTEQGVFGYYRCPDELFEVVMERLERVHQFKVKKEWIVWIPGLVPALGLSCRMSGQDGDAVMTNIPVYHPFMLETIAANRELQKVEMVLENGRWTMDFEAIEKSITPKTKLFLLCNPHNPCGTMFTKSELDKLGEICLKHNIVICSDEIHCDLILDKTKQHISIATLSNEIAQNSISLFAPSKTFNIAGLGCSFAVIPNDELRSKFMKTKAGLMPMIPPYSYQAALAAYKNGEEWLQELLVYLRSNHDFLLQSVAEMKGLKMVALEATYLAWIDARETGMADVVERLEAAGVGVNAGKMYDGEGFFRLNFACTRANLEEVVKRMKTIF